MITTSLPPNTANSVTLMSQSEGRPQILTVDLCHTIGREAAIAKTILRKGLSWQSYPLPMR
jgi:hypothetical protein